MTKKDRYYIYLMSFLNIPYVWGGVSPDSGLDCSGAVQIWLSYFGLDPKDDQNANSLYQHFLLYGKKSSPIDIGHLLFFGNVSKISHVAMAIDMDTMIEAGGGGSATLSRDVANKQGAFIRVRPISSRKDMVDALKPSGLPW